MHTSNSSRLRAGDLVKVRGERRKYVALPVTVRDLRRGMNAVQPGLHLFGGYWYAAEAKGGPLRSHAYGKILALRPGLQVRKVGRVCSHYAAQRHCR